MILMVVVALIGMILVGAIGLNNLNTNLLEDRYLKTKQLVEAARSIVVHYHELAKKGQMPEADAKARALAEMAVLRYADNNYFFVNDFDGVLLMHPFRAKQIGTSMLQAKKKDGTLYTDVRGVPLYQAFADTAKAGGGFVHYTGRAPGSDREDSPKVSYIGSFEPWRMAIATGIYVNDVDAVFSDNLKQMAIWIGGVLIVVLGIAWRISVSIGGPLKKITGDMARLAGGDTEIEVSATTSKYEIGELTNALVTFRDNAVEV
ncbi:MAG: cache domain-containing protein, partial [Rhodospirillaceae bacterium]